MAAPTFSKTGVTTYTFGRARAFPVNIDRKPQQRIIKSGGGQAQVIKYGERELFLDIVVRGITEANRDLLIAFLEDSLIDYSMNTFTFTDEDGTTYVGRYYSSKGLKTPEYIDGYCSFKITFRVEVV